ncbi:hypothetical protein BDP81DRAFT_394697 [Colletotrichum phormii]|uniref:Uncharacterized protein n=1 Tax=Colletotrichum phormii TaxID=359342 RepID=A0AAI9ZSW0_9PEZI|nr:uncharacterized protein BDP81DRAFT_394697 [Colletotrichum phormii]KAK1636047.1 hypothetical protein BDP81DRAFT_394697 [Colletotrichum phormii]
MCRRVYKHYTACGCVLNALFYDKCVRGPASPLCQKTTGIVTRNGETCPYHTRVARRQDRRRRQANGGTQDSEEIRMSIEDPFTFTGTGTEITPTKPEDRHKLGDFQFFTKDLDTFLKKLSEPENETPTESQPEQKLKQMGKNEQPKDKKVSPELSPLAGWSDWTDDDENDNAIARRIRRERLEKEFRAFARANEKKKAPFDLSDEFMSSDCGDDNDVSDSSSYTDPGDMYPSPMSLSPYFNNDNEGDVSESNESSDTGDVHPSSSSLDSDQGDDSVVPKSSNSDSDHGHMMSTIPRLVQRNGALYADLSWNTPPENSDRNMGEGGETEDEETEVEEAEDESDYDSEDSDMPDADEDDDGDYVPEPTWPPTGVEWTSKLKYMSGIPRRAAAIIDDWN